MSTSTSAASRIAPPPKEEGSVTTTELEEKSKAESKGTTVYTTSYFSQIEGI